MNSFVSFLLISSISLIAISFIIKLFYRKKKQLYFNFNGRIIYEDLHEINQSLHSKILPLCGKPDYILQQKRNIRIPVEVKTGNHTKPRNHHIIQLLCYCQLVEETFHNNVPYGLLIYYDTKYQFKIPFNKKHKKLLLSTIENMQSQIEKGAIVRNHISVSKCLSCSMNNFCTQKLS